MSNQARVVTFLSCFFYAVSFSYAAKIPVLKNQNNIELSQKKIKPIASASILSKKININQANAKTIAAAFNGIGVKRSQAIVEYRKAHGVFNSLDELSLVKGISKRFIQKNSEKLKETFIL